MYYAKVYCISRVNENHSKCIIDKWILCDEYSITCSFEPSISFPHSSIRPGQTLETGDFYWQPTPSALFLLWRQTTFSFWQDTYQCTYNEEFTKDYWFISLVVLLRLYFTRINTVTKDYWFISLVVLLDTVFTRINAAAFISNLVFQLWRLFESGVYLRAAFITKYHLRYRSFSPKSSAYCMVVFK